MTPLLDTMKNIGAISDYYMVMSADIDGTDKVRLNSIVGQIFIAIHGVITTLSLDLIALPSSVNLDDYRA